jgi:hypothetical protein
VRARFQELFWASSTKLFRFAPFGRASASGDGEAAAKACQRGPENMLEICVRTYVCF